VQLQNVSDDQSTPVVIAEQTIATEGKNVPIPFSLNYDPATIDSDRNYRVFVTIYDGESERFVSTQNYAVITKDNPSTDVTVMLTMVSNEESPVSPVPVLPSVPILAGTSWVWQFTEGDTVASSSRSDAPSGEQFVLTFTADNFNSTTDCNQLSGGYLQNNEALSLGPIAATKMACADETLEATYATALARVGSYTVTGGELRLMLLEGTGTMVFAQKPSEISIEEEAVFCTQDAMECPDGSFVGRVAPGCAFAPCGEALVE
jgi:putative lipoprotein